MNKTSETDKELAVQYADKAWYVDRENLILVLDKKISHREHLDTYAVCYKILDFILAVAPLVVAPQLHATDIPKEWNRHSQIHHESKANPASA